VNTVKYFIVSFLVSVSAYAADAVPDCKAGGQTLAPNEAQVINWKNTSQNQFHSRAHVVGTLVQQYPDHSGHHHFKVKIGPNTSDTVEVIYNESFGALPQVQPGSQIEACGDYITSKKKSGPYPASPDGAIIHWVHRAPNSNHDSGFLIVDGIVCGQNSGGAGPKAPHYGGRHHGGSNVGAN
jgi:uncharacterized protein DUF3465